MESQRIVRRFSAVAGGLAIVAMVGLSASCAKEEEEAPETHDHHDADHHISASGARSASGPCADREEHQPHRRQPVHAAGLCAPGTDGASRSSPQQLEPPDFDPR